MVGKRRLGFGGAIYHIQQSRELGVGEFAAVEGLELSPKISFQSRPVGDVGADAVFEIAEFGDEGVLDVPFA
jgi:hypothetical protein